MGQFKALILAGAFALGGVQVALSADLLPPPPQVDMPLRGSIVDTSGFYVRGDLGLGVNTLGKQASYIAAGAPAGLSYDGQTIGDSAIVGLGAGYQFNSWFRADVTGEWRSNATWHSRESFTDNPTPGNTCMGNTSGANPGRCQDLYKANIGHSVFLANGYVDLGNWGGLTPYLGLGLGGAYNHVGSIEDLSPNYSSYHYSAAASKWTFAWALMAGMSYDVTSSLKVDVGYRYLNMGSMNGGLCVCSTESQRFKFQAHDLRLGLRYAFNADVAPPPQPMPPLVRKY